MCSAAGVVVGDGFALDGGGLVSVAAENTVRLAEARMRDSARSDLRGKPQPACTLAIQKAGKCFAFEIELLQLQMQEGSKITQEQIVDHKAVELVAVNGQVTATFKFPLVFFVDFHSHQVRHNLAQSAVMVAFHPHHLDAALGVRELADVAEKLPV